MTSNERETFEIVLPGRPDIRLWARDSFTGQPLYNADGTRKRERIMIQDPNDPDDDGEIFDVLAIEYNEDPHAQ